MLVLLLGCPKGPDPAATEPVATEVAADPAAAEPIGDPGAASIDGAPAGGAPADAAPGDGAPPAPAGSTSGTGAAGAGAGTAAGDASTGTDPLYRALAVRDPEPDCATVEALVPEPVPALLHLVETVSMPPAVPMRAAGCLVDRHAVEVADTIEGWMSADGSLGLALLVAGRIDELPPELAVRFARAGRAGPHAAELERLLAESGNPEVRGAK